MLRVEQYEQGKQTILCSQGTFPASYDLQHLLSRQDVVLTSTKTKFASIPLLPAQGDTGCGPDRNKALWSKSFLRWSRSWNSHWTHTGILKLVLCGSYESHTDKSSKLIPEGTMYVSTICLVMFGFIVLNFQTSVQHISQISKFILG